MKIEFSDDAELQVQFAINYYDSINEILSNQLLDDLEHALMDVVTSPLIFQIRYRNVRLIHLQKFPFSVHFEVFDKNIQVYQFLHHKQFK